MKSKMKWLALLTISLVILGLILGSTGTALAAKLQGDEDPAPSQFSLLGGLESKSPVADQPLLETWMVDGQVFFVRSAPSIPPAEGVADDAEPTVCSNPAGEVIACADVLLNDVISVSGDLVHASGAQPEAWYARSVQVVSFVDEGEELFSYTGVLTPIDSHSAWIGEYIFVGDEATIRPDFFAPGDTVLVTFMVLEDGTFYATSAEIVVQAAPYTYQGTLESMADHGDGSFTWLVGGKSFLVTAETSLPAEYATGDEVKVSFLVQAGSNLALSIELVTAHTPSIPPSIPVAELCEHGLEDYPELLKRAEEMGIADPAALLEYFCSGVSADEILKAIQLAAGSAYAPQELLAMFTGGMSWEEIEQLVAGHSEGEGEDADPTTGSHSGEALRRYIKTINLQLPQQWRDFGNPGNVEHPDDSEHGDNGSGDSGEADHPEDPNQGEECNE